MGIITGCITGGQLELLKSGLETEPPLPVWKWTDLWKSFGSKSGPEVFHVLIEYFKARMVGLGEGITAATTLLEIDLAKLLLTESDPRIIRAILKFGLDFNYCNKALCHACRSGDLEKAEILVQVGQAHPFSHNLRT